jgi:hypothetical protein
MSHMATSHVGQIGCGSFEGVSAPGTARVLPVVSPLLIILTRGEPHSPAPVPPCECGRTFHTGKSESAPFPQGQRWLSIRVCRHNGARTRAHVRASHAELHHLTYWRRGRPQFGFNRPGWQKRNFVRMYDRACPVSSLRVVRS